MSIIARMLTKMIFTRFLLILVGLSLFVIMLDTLRNMDSILVDDSTPYTELFRYALLRFPQVTSTFWTLSLLLAVLLALTELGWRNETVIFWAAGLSPLGLAVMLLPLGIILGIAQFIITDHAVPLAAKQLREWGVGDYSRKKTRIGENDPIWMRAGNDIVRAGKTNSGLSRIDELTIFRRDKDGLLTEQIIARTAEKTNGRWLLHDVLIYPRESVPAKRLDSMIYSGTLRFAAVGMRSGDPEEMSLSDLGYFIDNSGFGIRPVFVYQAWWHKRLSLLITAWLMIAVIIPLSARFRRGGAIGYMFGIGVAIGFAYFIFDGISMTIGEMGLAPPIMAAWIPVLVLALAAASLMLKSETVA